MHNCDLKIEGADEDKSGLVMVPVVSANEDGTYEIDFSNCFCPEFDNAFESVNVEDIGNSIEVQTCAHTWTAVIYNNYAKIG
jgi:hypothetical protein